MCQGVRLSWLRPSWQSPPWVSWEKGETLWAELRSLTEHKERRSNSSNNNSSCYLVEIISRVSIYTTQCLCWAKGVVLCTSNDSAIRFLLLHFADSIFSLLFVFSFVFKWPIIGTETTGKKYLSCSAWSCFTYCCTSLKNVLSFCSTKLTCLLAWTLSKCLIWGL